MKAMPWTADYLTDGAYMSFWGATTGDEVVRAKTHFYAQAYKAGPRFAVLDFSKIECLDVDRIAIGRVAAQDVVAAAEAVPDLAVAVVAPHPVTYGMARMWEMQVAETGWRTKVARSRPEAFAWLEEQGIATDRFAVLQG